MNRAKHRHQSSKDSRLEANGRRVTTSRLVRLLRSLQSLGVSGLPRSLVALSTWSFVAGLAQAGLLIVLSQLAVSGVQHSGHLTIKGHSFSTDVALVAGLGLLAVFFIAGMITALMTSSVSSRSLEAGRNKMIDAFFGADWSVQSGERLGNIQQLLTVNCESLALIVQVMSAGLQSLLTVIALLLVAFIVSPVIAIGVLIAGLLLFVILRPINTWGRRTSVQMAADSLAMSTSVTEYTRLARDFRLFGVQSLATHELHDRNSRAATSFRKNRRLGLSVPVVYQTFALGLVVVGLVVLSGHSGSNLGTTGAVVLLILRSLSYGATIQSSSQLLQTYDGLLDGLRDQLRRFSENTQTFTNIPLPSSYDIDFENVTFAYDERHVIIHDASFVVPDGQILGIVGRSGSGKTTVSQLILGLRAPIRGDVLIGDVPAGRIVRDDGTSPLALVAQEPILLRGSVASNISMFRQVSREDIETAARAAHIHDEIAAMPGGYDLEVGEGGGSLSGGQRQRLAIARALVGHPRLLVLDEPTSALDGRSEQLIRQTLSELRGSVTVVVISHRLVTVEDCDLLLVLENGRIAEFGPRDVVRRGAAFRKVADDRSSVLDGPVTPDETPESTRLS
jgi:ATP-binding cassette subfamily B protein